jgi:hypothetical protein
MRHTPFERELRDELHAARPPRADEAERRAWHIVRSAHAARTPVPERRRTVRLAAAFAAMAAVAALALSPAGAKVGDWIDEVVSPAPEATRSTLASLPAKGRLLVIADSGPWIVQDDGARRRLGGFGDATWSPGGLFVAAARGRELVALEPDGDERWTRPGPGRVSVPRWSPDGFRIAYRSGSDLWVATGDNAEAWRLARGTGRAAPAWKPLAAPAEQVVAFARGGRVHIADVDRPRRRPVRTPPGPAPREIWWADGGRRLVTVAAGAVRVHSASGRLLRRIALPRGLRAEGSALAPGGRRLAIIATRPGGRTSELMLLRVDRRSPPRRIFSAPGAFEGLSWSIDGALLVLGLPEADQWLFVRPGAAAGLEAVKRIRAQFAGGARPRTGMFPRPAGWCYAEPEVGAGADRPPCSSGAAR